MTWKKWIGTGMMAVLVFGALTMLAMEGGWVNTLITFGAVLALLLWVLTAVSLIVD